MLDAVFQYFHDSLPEDLGPLLSDEIGYYEKGDFQAIFRLPLVKILLGHDPNDSTQNSLEKFPHWNDYIFDRLGTLLAQRKKGIEADKHSSPAFLQHLYFLVALAALQAFVQSNVTGPPLPFSSVDVIFPRDQAIDSKAVKSLRTKLIASLGVDGEAAYKLTPNVELFCLADTIITCPPIQKSVVGARWLKLRIHFLHQRLLSEVSSTLQSQIYEELDYLATVILSSSSNAFSPEARVEFLLERASIHMHHGFDKKAREDLDQAAKERHFQFVLTGRLGKRTKYQQTDASQLVVLARSAVEAKNGAGRTEAVASGSGPPTKGAVKGASSAKPENLDLNDDTLLDRISFAESTELATDVQDESSLSPSLSSLDPANQPMLHPLDSIILLSLASSITNTSPQDGLTREETLPYATRVLEGGSSNWQVYTQALLVRSRIEGYKSRTTERGLLQLQALVDQIIADTTPSTSKDAGATETAAPSTFLPQPKESESAPVMDRLRYVYQLCSPTRWELEAELASRWVSLGGLRSALEIYERLEMWAEAALCWAAVEREDKATKTIRRQLFDPSSEPPLDDDQESWEGAPRDPPPPDAPRLYCILGDITHDISYYETAWTMSNGRYARAQRSLGRHYFATGDFAKAANAYGKALKVNQLNRSSWFALGCAHLELSQFDRAVEAFSRTVQLDDTDAEAWSNLAAALLRLDSGTPSLSEPSNQTIVNEDDDEEATSPQRPQRDPQQHKKDALNALKRAASLNYENFRIWDNLLTVAASLSPPSYTDIIAAQTRIIEIRGKAVGENCIDVDVLKRLVRDILSSPSNQHHSSPTPTPISEPKQQRGPPNLLLTLVDTHIKPLITTSHRLWNLVAKIDLHFRNRPAAALIAIEKGWRAVISLPGWENGEEGRWEEVVQATVELADAYESLGGRERESDGRGAEVAGKEEARAELVARDWKFKARSAIRGVMGRGKGSWEGSAGWERLKGRLEELNG